MALPVLVALLIRLAGGGRDTAAILDALVIRTVLPLVALMIGTSAIGSSEDGTAIYLLIKPIARWRIALAKMGVAAGLAVVLVVPPMILTGILIAGTDGAALGTTFGYSLAAIGDIAYACLFTALGALTSRALIVGLLYVLLWEGVLSGLLEGTQFLSIRQATLGLAAAWTGGDQRRDRARPDDVGDRHHAGRHRELRGHDPGARALPDPLGGLTSRPRMTGRAGHA